MTTAPTDPARAAERPTLPDRDGGHLKRRLGLASAISITVGSVIGSGIFLKPLSISQALPGVGWIYVLWVALGAVCLFGAFAYAELGTMFPEAGGQYAFLREGWGGGVSFLYGWALFWIINSGTIAALSIAFADYLLPLFGVDMQAEAESPRLKIAVAAVMVIALAIVNHFGVLWGAVVQNVSTVGKVGALAVLVVAGLMLIGGHDAAAQASAAAAASPLTVGGLVTAFIGIFWAYEGWYQLPFNAAELKRPQRDLPLGLIVGMLILIVTYVAVNAIYLRVVPFEEMRALQFDREVPYLAVSRVFSPRVADYLTLLVAVSVLGSANPGLLSTPRGFYAMGRDGMVPRALTWVHPRWGTPTVAIWTQAFWSIALVVGLRGFHDVTAFVVFATFIFYALTVAAVYRLRRARPDHPRPYRCMGYPLTPALFIVVAVAFVVALLTDPAEQRNALIGLGLLATGLPFYAWQRRRAARAALGESAR
jgi:basic amino acid/polyamine antiporter, APA family